MFHIFKVLSQELVQRKWPLKVKQQFEIALACALKHRWADASALGGSGRTQEPT
jgi:hypothetical protein